jgi:hypothetical protein
VRIPILVIAGLAGCGFDLRGAPGAGDAVGAIDAATIDALALDALDAVAPDAAPQRIAAGLVALYTFEEGTGSTVIDRSGFGAPLDLTVGAPANVAWGSGTLTVNTATLIASPGVASKVLTACRDADALTLEAWIRPAAIGGYFPRVVTLSTSNDSLALTLMAIDSHFEFRMRGPMTDDNGLPSLNSPTGSIAVAPIHVALVSEPGGMRRIYVDGVETATDARGGDLATWGTTGHRLGLADEIDGGRPWLGTFDLVAVYAVALSPAEIATNFAAGPQ